MKCRVCSSKTIKFFSLGQMPLVNSFLKEEEITSEEKFELSVSFCPECFLVQLMENVPPERLFRDYIYFSSTSKSFLEHCKENAQKLTQRLGLNSQSLVLEIASNDGAQLQYFKELNIGILGVDPAQNIAEEANKRGIPTLADFFNSNFAKRLKMERHIQADLVFGANVLAHVPEIVDFVDGLKIILKPKGTAVFEFPYIQGLMGNKFDTIYHEHVFYYSLIALKNIFERAGLEIYDVERTEMQGGSLQIFISRSGNFKISKNVIDLAEEEIKSDFNKIETYEKINNNVTGLKSEITSLFESLKKKGKKIAAYGAPAKGNVLLNYFGIGRDYIDFIVDKSEAKQGLYTPGTHLLVHPLEKIYEANPDYLLILCWNIADEVVNMPELAKFRKNCGQFIIPIPEIKII
jgi:SAM-dependent methyltransferase